MFDTIKISKPFLYIFIIAYISIFNINVYANYAWPYAEVAAKIDGDIYLGVLLNIHQQNGSNICGPVTSEGIQALEVVLSTLEYINALNLLPGFSLGLGVKDVCDSERYALEQAVGFLPGAGDVISEVRCSDGSNPRVTKRKISGVVDATSSTTSISLANLFRLFESPQICAYSVDPFLNDEQLFPFVLRTIPSADHQWRAMVEVVKMLNWTYVSVVHEDSRLGYEGLSEVSRLFREAEICIHVSVSVRIQRVRGTPDQEHYNRVVERLKSHQRARGVLVLASEREVNELMKTVRRRNATGMFAWIGYEGLIAKHQGYETEVEGAIAVRPLAHVIQSFKDHFLNLRPDTNRRNPWFVEYWEQLFECKFSGSKRTPYNQNFDRLCDGAEVVSEESLEFDNRLQFVSNALMVFAYGLRDAHSSICGGQPGICDGIDNLGVDTLLGHLQGVHFTGLWGEEFAMNEDRAGQPIYEVLNFQQDTEGHFQWKTIGVFDQDHFRTIQNPKFRVNEPRYPESICSRPCPEGTLKVPAGDNCCWVCIG